MSDMIPFSMPTETGLYTCIVRERAREEIRQIWFFPEESSHVKYSNIIAIDPEPVEVYEPMAYPLTAKQVGGLLEAISMQAMMDVTMKTISKEDRDTARWWLSGTRGGRRFLELLRTGQVPKKLYRCFKRG